MGTIYAFCWRCQREGGDVISNDCSIHSAHARHVCIFYDVCFTAFSCKLINNNDFYYLSPGRP